MTTGAAKRSLLALALLMTLPAAAQHPGWFSGDVSGIATASGTWADHKPNPALLYSTRIECFRSQKMCIEATAQGDAVEPGLEYFEIVTWNKDEIIARDSVICGVVILRFDFVAESVSTTLVPNGEPGYQGICKMYLPPPTMLGGSLQDRVKKKAK